MCDSGCGPLIIDLLTGAPGIQGETGPQGPQGPPGAVANVTGDIVISIENIVTVQGLQQIPLAATTPTTNQFIAFDGTQYKPTSFSAGTY